MPKGGVGIAEHVLFGKYRLCRKLGAGRSGTVYLAFHCGLEEYRAVKIVPKTITYNTRLIYEIIIYSIENIAIEVATTGCI